MKTSVKETDGYTTGEETVRADTTYVKQIAKEVNNSNIQGYS
jgi:hypothetical protein